MSNDFFQRPEKTNGHSTFDEFNLKCEVVKIKKSWNEAADEGRQHEGEMIALVFDKDATESWKFMTAWKPEPEEERNYEFAMFIGPPINSPARGCYRLKDKDIKQDYIFLMNHAIELQLIQQLKFHKGKLYVYVVVYPEDADDIADSAPDSGREIDKRFKGMGE